MTNKHTRKAAGTYNWINDFSSSTNCIKCNQKKKGYFLLSSNSKKQVSLYCASCVNTNRSQFKNEFPPELINELIVLSRSIKPERKSIIPKQLELFCLDSFQESGEFLIQS